MLENGERGRIGEMGRNGEMGRWGGGEMRSWGNGDLGRWGVGEMGSLLKWGEKWGGDKKIGQGYSLKQSLSFYQFQIMN